ncbi:hypothetical protein SAMN02746041_00338 [Desulfacinum hydrothermale DSM 13146]|uniref:Uncharacterized protein n=1 Tax=Desulfacinum hydrothermale DSM 13146 TaxID=1121390 RepID=A0A1W1X2A5_9BACT|nr:hypothetical protein SAMN02746041_00338 [Desulfacinum hydrothermale DSM 13146]
MAAIRFAVICKKGAGGKLSNNAGEEAFFPSAASKDWGKVPNPCMAIGYGVPLGGAAMPCPAGPTSHGYAGKGNLMAF